MADKLNKEMAVTFGADPVQTMYGEVISFPKKLDEKLIPAPNIESYDNRVKVDLKGALMTPFDEKRPVEVNTETPKHEMSLGESVFWDTMMPILYKKIHPEDTASTGQLVNYMGDRERAGSVYEDSKKYAEFKQAELEAYAKNPTEMIKKYSDAMNNMNHSELMSVANSMAIAQTISYGSAPYELVSKFAYTDKEGLSDMFSFNEKMLYNTETLTLSLMRDAAVAGVLNVAIPGTGTGAFATSKTPGISNVMTKFMGPYWGNYLKFVTAQSMGSGLEMYNQMKDKKRIEGLDADINPMATGALMAGINMASGVLLGPAVNKLMEPWVGKLTSYALRKVGLPQYAGVIGPMAGLVTMGGTSNAAQNIAEQNLRDRWIYSGAQTFNYFEFALATFLGTAFPSMQVLPHMIKSASEIHKAKVNINISDPKTVIARKSAAMMNNRVPESESYLYSHIKNTEADYVRKGAPQQNIKEDIINKFMTKSEADEVGDSIHYNESLLDDILKSRTEPENDLITKPIADYFDSPSSPTKRRVPGTDADIKRMEAGQIIDQINEERYAPTAKPARSFKQRWSFLGTNMVEADHEMLVRATLDDMAGIEDELHAYKKDFDILENTLFSKIEPKSMTQLKTENARLLSLKAKFEGSLEEAHGNAKRIIESKITQTMWEEGFTEKEIKAKINEIRNGAREITEKDYDIADAQAEMKGENVPDVADSGTWLEKYLQIVKDGMPTDPNLTPSENAVKRAAYFSKALYDLELRNNSASALAETLLEDAKHFEGIDIKKAVNKFHTRVMDYNRFDYMKNLYEKVKKIKDMAGGTMAEKFEDLSQGKSYITKKEFDTRAAGLLNFKNQFYSSQLKIKKEFLKDGSWFSFYNTEAWDAERLYFGLVDPDAKAAVARHIDLLSTVGKMKNDGDIITRKIFAELKSVVKAYGADLNKIRKYMDLIDNDLALNKKMDIKDMVVQGHRIKYINDYVSDLGLKPEEVMLANRIANTNEWIFKELIQRSQKMTPKEFREAITALVSPSRQFVQNRDNFQGTMYFPTRWNEAGSANINKLYAANRTSYEDKLITPNYKKERSITREMAKDYTNRLTAEEELEAHFSKVAYSVPANMMNAGYDDMALNIFGGMWMNQADRFNVMTGRYDYSDVVKAPKDSIEKLFGTVYENKTNRMETLTATDFRSTAAEIIDDYLVAIPANLKTGISMSALNWKMHPRNFMQAQVNLGQFIGNVNVAKNVPEGVKFLNTFYSKNAARINEAVIDMMSKLPKDSERSKLTIDYLTDHAAAEGLYDLMMLRQTGGKDYISMLDRGIMNLENSTNPKYAAMGRWMENSVRVGTSAVVAVDFATRIMAVNSIYDRIEQVTKQTKWNPGADLKNIEKINTIMKELDVGMFGPSRQDKLINLWKDGSFYEFKKEYTRDMIDFTLYHYDDYSRPKLYGMASKQSMRKAASAAVRFLSYPMYEANRWRAAIRLANNGDKSALISQLFFTGASVVTKAAMGTAIYSAPIWLRMAMDTIFGKSPLNSILETSEGRRDKPWGMLESSLQVTDLITSLIQGKGLKAVEKLAIKQAKSWGKFAIDDAQMVAEAGAGVTAAWEWLEDVIGLHGDEEDKLGLEGLKEYYKEKGMYERPIKERSLNERPLNERPIKDRMINER